MQDPALNLNSCLTPKRKRDTEDTFMTDAPSPSRLKTSNLPSRPSLESDSVGDGSPRLSVAGHLQNLGLEESHPIPKLDFGMPVDSKTGISNRERRSGAFNPRIFLPTQTLETPISPPPSSHENIPMIAHVPSEVSERKKPLEIPETPRLRPVSSPTPPPSGRKSGSPSPISPSLWWSDAEITGHDPKDPADDGYGINGIGFIPTPAIANARTERRKKQVAEWKHRESREARQRRSDKRRRRDAESRSLNEKNDSSPKKGARMDEIRKVRFLEI